MLVTTASTSTAWPTKAFESAASRKCFRLPVGSLRFRFAGLGFEPPPPSASRRGAAPCTGSSGREGVESGGEGIESGSAEHLLPAPEHCLREGRFGVTGVTGEAAESDAAAAALAIAALTEKLRFLFRKLRRAKACRPRRASILRTSAPAAAEGGGGGPTGARPWARSDSQGDQQRLPKGVGKHSPVSCSNTQSLPSQEPSTLRLTGSLAAPSLAVQKAISSTLTS
mmetsp:Transcript_2641/g.6466  ORF Transcript_2641/g.6466 Transcript_2641/m.6466 type:complete len:226 (+) Transcript_2641:280-957(+)